MECRKCLNSCAPQRNASQQGASIECNPVRAALMFTLGIEYAYTRSSVPLGGVYSGTRSTRRFATVMFVRTIINIHRAGRQLDRLSLGHRVSNERRLVSWNAFQETLPSMAVSVKHLAPLGHRY